MIGEESVEVIRLSVAMIFLAVVLAAATFVTILGKSYFTSYMDGVEEREESSYTSVFSTFTGDAREVSVATVYAMAYYYSEYVGDITLTGFSDFEDGTVITTDDMLSINLSGRCLVTATPHSGELKMYDLNVEAE
jgi:hypothetical protein